LRLAGIPFLDKTRIESLSHADGTDAPVTSTEPWRIVVRAADETTRELTAKFLVDATGEAAVLPRTLGLQSTVDGLQTRSRSLFTHLRGVGSWTEWMRRRGGRVDEHPFNCDDAAQHQLVDGAWMWILRFNQGTTSIGLAIDMDRHPLDERLQGQAEWSWWMARYPSLAQLVKDAKFDPVPGRWIRSERIQRRFARVVGPNWALLPHTAGFIDPLHSSGIAHSLCGVERLTDSLLAEWRQPSLVPRLQAYEAAVLGEVDVIDRLVAGCYATLGDFRLFVAWSMLYFAAATTYERRRATGGRDAVGWFLCADDQQFTNMIRRLEERRRTILAGGSPTPADVAAFEADVARELRPYSHAGLCDPAARNMYRFTAAPV
jgi:FADH2 O2-dependent halogenase